MHSFFLVSLNLPSPPQPPLAITSIPPFFFVLVHGGRVACSLWPSSFELSNLSSLVIYFFLTPPIKLKLKAGSAYTCETTNSKPPGPIIMISESEPTREQHCDHISLYTLFSVRCLYVLCLTQKCRAKTILLSQNWPVLTFPHPILNNQNEVSSESGNKVIHKVTTLSFTSPPLPFPLFQWYQQSKEISQYCFYWIFLPPNLHYLMHKVQE